MNALQDMLNQWDNNTDAARAYPEAFVAVFVEAARAWAVVQEAILNEGPKPYHHRRVMARHQAEWPTLWDALTPLAGTTHQTPQEGLSVMPCCGRTPFEVPRTDRITTDTDLVTCAFARKLDERSRRPKDKFA